jgi:hypothetical protein
LFAETYAYGSVSTIPFSGLRRTPSRETASWDQDNSSLCDRCACEQIQDEVHALLVCKNATVCALRIQFAYLFSQLLSVCSVEQYYLQQQVSAQVVYEFLLQHNTLVSFVSELMDLIVDWLGPVTVQSAEKSG